MDENRGDEETSVAVTHLPVVYAVPVAQSRGVSPTSSTMIDPLFVG